MTPLERKSGATRVPLDGTGSVLLSPRRRKPVPEAHATSTDLDRLIGWGLARLGARTPPEIVGAAAV